MCIVSVADINYQLKNIVTSFVLAMDVIMQEVALQSEMGNKAQEILLKGEAIPEEIVAQMLENKINSPEVAHHGMTNSTGKMYNVMALDVFDKFNGVLQLVVDTLAVVFRVGYVLDGFPTLSEEYMSIKDQLELIKNWRLKPDFIVNLKVMSRKAPLTITRVFP